MAKKYDCTTDHDAPHQQRFQREGMPYAGTAKPDDSANGMPARVPDPPLTIMPGNLEHSFRKGGKE